MARKRASPTAAPTMLGVLRFMVFSLDSVRVGRREEGVQRACQVGGLGVPGACSPGMSGIPDEAPGMADEWVLILKTCRPSLILPGARWTHPCRSQFQDLSAAYASHFSPGMRRNPACSRALVLDGAT